MQNQILSTNSRDLENKGIPALVQMFADSFRAAVGSYVDACRIYAHAIKRAPDAKEKFREALPEIPPGMWTRFEAVGNGYMHPVLLTSTHHSARKLERLPYSDQIKALESRLEFLTRSGDVVKVKLSECDADMVAQLLDKDHIRSLSEQWVFLEQKRRMKKSGYMRRETPYTVLKDKVQFRADTELTRSELLDILKQLG